MNILVLGNGFDVAHNLPTTYRDFILCCKALFNNSLIKGKDVIDNDIVRSVVEKAKKDDKYDLIKKYPFEILECAICENKFKRDLSTCTNLHECDVVRKYKEMRRETIDALFVKYFFEKITEIQWCDIEHDIESCIDKIEQLVTQEGKEFFVHKQNSMLLTDFDLNDVIRNEKNISLDSIKFIRPEIINSVIHNLSLLLKQYLLWINNNKLFNIMEKFNLSELKIEGIINFNYTSTYQRIYDNSIKCCYIHGSVESDIVLGGRNKSIKEKYPLLDKEFQRLFYSTSSEYVDWLSNNKENIIYIIGHSLDIIDGDVLRFILNHENVEKVIIYYHNEESYCRYITNLRTILGTEILYKRMHNGENSNIFLISQDNIQLDIKNY